MEKLYAQALWKAIASGHESSKVVAALAKNLQRQGRSALMPKIARAFKRLAEAQQALAPRVYVAREKDAKHALQAAGVSHAAVQIDESLIGGWRFEGNNQVVDRSFKKFLLDIYNASNTQ